MSDNNSLYYYDDKDLYDAIFSSKKHLSDIFLRDQAAERGVFCSYQGDTRKNISDFFSTWFNDYETLSLIKDKLSGGQRRPKFEPERIISEGQGVSITDTQVEEALQSCKDELANNNQESFDFSKTLLWGSQG